MQANFNSTLIKVIYKHQIELVKTDLLLTNKNSYLIFQQFSFTYYINVHLSNAKILIICIIYYMYLVVRSEREIL